MAEEEGFEPSMVSQHPNRLAGGRLGPLGHPSGKMGTPGEIRTPDLQVKSLALCPLSYGGTSGGPRPIRTVLSRASTSR